MAPTGIVQGSLSDCWFLAAATALAEQEGRLDHAIHRNSRDVYNKGGIFRYYFWIKDQWIAINVDDKLPVRYKYSNSDEHFLTLFAGKSKNGAWWMPLFEKAYSKLNGEYSRIEWGSGFESLRQLTNRPVFYYKHSDISNEQEMFNKVHSMALANYPMVIACCDTPNKNDPAPDGLKNNHAYTLLDVVTLQGQHLAKIRNPWAKETYTGAWSDTDPVW